MIERNIASLRVARRLYRIRLDRKVHKLYLASWTARSTSRPPITALAPSGANPLPRHLGLPGPGQTSAEWRAETCRYHDWPYSQTQWTGLPSLISHFGIKGIRDVLVPYGLDAFRAHTFGAEAFDPRVFADYLRKVVGLLDMRALPGLLLLADLDPSGGFLKVYSGLKQAYLRDLERVETYHAMCRSAVGGKLRPIHQQAMFDDFQGVWEAHRPAFVQLFVAMMDVVGASHEVPAAVASFRTALAPETVP